VPNGSRSFDAWWFRFSVKAAYGILVSGPVKVTCVSK